MLTRNAEGDYNRACMTATRERQGHDDAAGSRVREDVLRFGAEDQLVGVVSRPCHPAPATPAAPAIVLLNAGVLHRVGPHRLHVLLARHLAGLGYTSLRLDLGGIGDSTAATDASTFRESAVADTRLVMGGLDAGRYVLFGICAGADNALATALVDPRVTGVVLVDPHVYANRRGKLRELRTKVVELGGPGPILRWGIGVTKRRIRGRIEKFQHRNDPAPPAEGREPPPIAEFRAQLRTLVDRGVSTYAIYSGIHGARYNAPDQLFEVFPELAGRVDCAYFPEANHTFTELAAQKALIAAVTTWICTRFRS